MCHIRWVLIWIPNVRGEDRVVISLGKDNCKTTFKVRSIPQLLLYYLVNMNSNMNLSLGKSPLLTFKCTRAFEPINVFQKGKILYVLVKSCLLVVLEKLYAFGKCLHDSHNMWGDWYLHAVRGMLHMHMPDEISIFVLLGVIYSFAYLPYKC